MKQGRGTVMPDFGETKKFGPCCRVGIRKYFKVDLRFKEEGAENWAFTLTAQGESQEPSKNLL